MRRSEAADQLVFGTDPSTGERINQGFQAASAADVDRLCKAAEDASDVFRQRSLADRAAFLERIAAEILDIGEPLVQTAVLETGLPPARIEGERGRTVGQLRLFADVVRRGDWLGVRIDTAQPERTPAPRSDLRLCRIPLGPVAVFGASNFPLAFSVAGGDTASALAAGCPVVVKAHPSHPGTSQLVADAIVRAVRATGMPEGTFGMLHSPDHAVAGALVADPRIKAVGFTGSRGGGLALMAIAAKREDPIPVFAEMSSINPVLVLPAALASRGSAIAAGYAASLTLGAGQFCTNPGLMLVLREPGVDEFLGSVSEAAAGTRPATMLSPQIHATHAAGLDRLRATRHARLLAEGAPASGPFEASASVFTVDSRDFFEDETLSCEVFGPTGIIVQCDTIEDMRRVIERLEGQLTIALHIDPADHPMASQLVPLLEKKAGRLLVNGFGTGVEVSDAMVHGGPFPATSDGRSTSVGTMAIDRFLRPVCYQDFPEELLPVALRDGNPLKLSRLIDGAWE